MDRLFADVRYALRALRKRPLFAVVAAGSLAIGIGANTALFTAVNTLLFSKPSGIPAADRVVELGRARDGSGFDTFTYPDFQDVREGASALQAAAAYQLETVAVSSGEEGVRTNAIYVSPAYFDVLGLAPARGRFFTADEDQGPDEHAVAVISWDFWQSRLAGDPGVVGSTVRLNRHPYTVVGVTPQGFKGHQFAFRPDVMLPLMQYPSMHEGQNLFDARNSSWIMVLGRLGPDATVDELNQQLDAVSTRLQGAYPDTNARRSFRAIPFGPVPGPARAIVRTFLGVLMAFVTLILLVTCANVAGMFLARATARSREVAVRLALGAGRGALLRQLTVEALLVFLVGGAVGYAVAAWATGLLRPGLLPVPIPLDFEISPDARVLFFSLAATLVTGLVFGLLPALQATRVSIVSALRDGGTRGAAAAGSSRLRRIFVAGQVGLSLVLLVAAGLFLRSLQRAGQVETGFDPSGAYMTGVDLAMEGYDDETGPTFQRRLVESLAARPEVEAAALATDLPLDMGRRSTVAVPEGWSSASGDPGLGVDFNQVSAAYFDALRIPVLQGRAFNEADAAGSERVAVVSRAFAERAWPGEQAVGRTLDFGSFDADRAEQLRVVGVVEDVKNGMITDQPEPFVYTALAQDYQAATQVVVRFRPGASGAGGLLRQWVLELDGGLSLTAVVSLERYTAIGVLPQRLAAGITSALGLLALLLAGLGVYGVVAFSVAQRTREIGVRMALGAGQGRVVRQVLRAGLWLALPGLAVGALLALGASQVLRSMLLGLSPFDPVALGGVAALLIGVVGLATWLPARRAASVAPAEALRSE